MTTMRIHSLAAATVVALAVVASGCDNNKLPTVNNNPNAPTTVPATTLFTNGVQTAVGNWLGSGYDLRNIELIVQQLAENQYIGNDQYKGVGPGGANTNWQSAYQNDLEDLQVVVRQGKAANDASLWAPALIMQQWEYGYLTDSWGDVPYSQALQGDSASAVLAPAYDPQQQIYQGFFTNLASAVTALASSTTSTLGAADPIYSGNKTEWQRFANSLRARDAMRIVNADPGTASTQLSAAFAAPGGVFKSNADNAQLDWPGDN